MTDSIADTALEGYPDYDSVTSDFMSHAKFRGKSLTEWESLLELPQINETDGLDELKTSNIEFLRICRLIINNYSYAKSSFNYFQMEVIRMGLKEGLDVSLYANPKYTLKQMEKFYFSLQTGTFKPGLSIKIKNLFKK